MRMPGFEPGISPPQGEVLTTILHTPGEAGYRSPYLSHAKRALYHLSYIPIVLIHYTILRQKPVHPLLTSIRLNIHNHTPYIHIHSTLSSDTYSIHILPPIKHTKYKQTHKQIQPKLQRPIHHPCTRVLRDSFGWKRKRDEWMGRTRSLRVAGWESFLSPVTGTKRIKHFWRVICMKR